MRREARPRQPQVTPRWGDAFLNRREATARARTPSEPGSRAQGAEHGREDAARWRGPSAARVPVGTQGGGRGSSLSPGTGPGPGGARPVLNACPLNSAQLGRCGREPAGSASAEHVLTVTPHWDGGMLRGHHRRSQHWPCRHVAEDGLSTVKHYTGAAGRARGVGQSEDANPRRPKTQQSLERIITAA